jgi:ribonucleoside-triphosphate reductase
MAVASSGTKVVKSSGETEVFDPNIITSDCVEAGVEFWTAAEVALEVSKDVFDGINSDEIQRKIIRALYNRNPEVAERYKRFISMYVRTSSNTIERFDRKRITNSLVKETFLPKEVAEIIAKETESELRRLNLEFTSGPLIREIVNVKLLEHGYEGARSDYTRLGMPVYDATQFIESAPDVAGNLGNPEAVHREMANSIFREYSLLKILPLHLADAHMKGDLHVHELEYFVTRPYTAIHDLRFFLKNGLRLGIGHGGSVAGPAKNAFTAVLHAVKAVVAFSSNFSSSQGLHLLNVWLAPYLEGLNEAQIRQLAQTCLFEISQTTPISAEGSPPIDLEIEYGIPDTVCDLPAILPGGLIKKSIRYKDFEEEAKEFARAVMQVYTNGDYSGSAFKTPKPIIKIREAGWEKEGFNDFMIQVHEAAAKNREINLLNLSTGQLGPNSSALSSGLTYQFDENRPLDNIDGTIRHFSLQCTSLNMPRIAYKAGGKEESFFETLDEAMGLAREIAMVKRDVLSKRIKQGSLPFLSQRADNRAYFDLEEASNLISYVGLNEAVKAHLGEELHESFYARDFGVSILQHVARVLSRWTKDNGLNWFLASVDNQGIARRFALLDSGQFSEVALVKGDTNSLNIHYTAACHVAKEAKLSPIERHKIEAPFYNFSPGGMMETISVKNEGADELYELSREMLKARAGYWSFRS